MSRRRAGQRGKIAASPRRAPGRGASRTAEADPGSGLLTAPNRLFQKEKPRQLPQRGSFRHLYLIDTACSLPHTPLSPSGAAPIRRPCG